MADAVRNDQLKARKNRSRTEGTLIRQFIVDTVDEHPKSVGAITAEKFGISRQAASKQVRRLVDEKILVPSGNTRNRSYRIASKAWSKVYEISAGLAEHDVWDQDVSPLLADLKRNVVDIWQFCFTEMFNNAVDHSGGSQIIVHVDRTAEITMMISDNGIGIFKKIQDALGLADERHAILELSKGKLTTDPEKHSGQGIFFTSRLLDSFNIFSGGVCFTHDVGADNDWMLELQEPKLGTVIWMKLNNNTERIDEEIFVQYSSQGGSSFAKTVVPVNLSRYGEEKLVSRSQAKRLLARVDQFETVVFDFSGVDSIGQAFADEIFRVFAHGHPLMRIMAISTNPRIDQVIESARSGWLPLNSLAPAKAPESLQDDEG